jgi:hypothetical protein
MTGAVRHKIVFVHSQPRFWRDLAELAQPPAPGEIAERMRGGRNAWVLQTYLWLRRRGLEAELATRCAPGALCVVHYDDLRARDLAADSYLLGARGDRPPMLLADQQVVQTPLLANGMSSHFVPNWPQPGLLPRAQERGARIERVGFVGRERNLAPEFRTPGFRRELAQHGFALVVREDRWWDYRDLDAVLAVRQASPAKLRTKPASKLVNAWHAGCPALLGPEPAFEARRLSPLDFLAVATPQEALAALRRLREDPGLYASMVENGRQRAKEFSATAIAARWEDLLAGPVAEDFERWRRAPRRSRWLRFAVRAAQQGVRRDRDRDYAHQQHARLWEGSP